MQGSLIMQVRINCTKYRKW